MKKLIIGLVVVASLSLSVVPVFTQATSKLITPCKASWGCITPTPCKASWG